MLPPPGYPSAAVRPRRRRPRAGSSSSAASSPNARDARGRVARRKRAVVLRPLRRAACTGRGRADHEHQDERSEGAQVVPHLNPPLCRRAGSITGPSARHRLPGAVPAVAERIQPDPKAPCAGAETVTVVEEALETLSSLDGKRKLAWLLAEVVHADDRLTGSAVVPEREHVRIPCRHDPPAARADLGAALALRIISVIQRSSESGSRRCASTLTSR